MRDVYHCTLRGRCDQAARYLQLLYIEPNEEVKWFDSLEKGRIIPMFASEEKTREVHRYMYYTMTFHLSSTAVRV